MAEEILRLGLYDSRPIVELETYGPGTYIQKMFCEGNSILSTVFVQALDGGASLYVEYFDYGVGGDVGEEVFLGDHNTITTALTSDRRLISKMHNKPVVRWTVTGGNVTFGVYVTVVVTQASDIDSALKYDGQTVNLLLDKGMPQVIYDTATGKWEFASGSDGIQDVAIVGNISVSENGDPVFAEANTVTTPGIEQSILSYTVPASMSLNLYAIKFICRQSCTFQVYGDSALIGSGRTGPSENNIYFDYRIARQFSAGKIIEVKTTARTGLPATEVEVYLQGTLT
jgi:hypothetical protein